MNPPTDRQYTSEHEWLQINDGIATVGITEYAAGALGDVVYVQLPTTGTGLTRGEVCGEIESTKSVSDLFAPADGNVVEINDEVADDPSAVNTDPYGKGWLFRMTLSGQPPLMDASTYRALTTS